MLLADPPRRCNSAVASINNVLSLVISASRTRSSSLMCASMLAQSAKLWGSLGVVSMLRDRIDYVTKKKIYYSKEWTV